VKHCENCEHFANEATKMKRLLAYERNANEGLRKAFFDMRNNLEDELAVGQTTRLRLRLRLRQTQSFNHTISILIFNTYKPSLQPIFNKHKPQLFSITPFFPFTFF
jgi:hypothetical protein